MQNPKFKCLYLHSAARVREIPKSEVLEVSAVALPAELPLDKEAWLVSKFPLGTSAILIDHASLMSWPRLPKILAGMDKPEFQFLPVLGLFDEPEQQKDFLDLGVADFVSADCLQSELVARVSLRVEQSNTDREIYDHNLNRIKKEAERETAVKQREEFLGICAHDLRSPLGLILSSLSMVISSEDKARLSQLNLELLTRAKRQADHAIGLVNDLLDVMSYEQGLKPIYELFDLHQFLKEFHEDYHLQAEEKKISFHYKNEVQGWRVLGDRARLRQLVQNLFANAVKFTDTGKNIHLTARPFVGKRKLDPPHPMVVISMRDEGKGIPEAEIQKIFDRFSQLKDYARAQGRGLGLTVAKQISQHHGGNVWVESKEGMGSTFHVLLPHVISHPKTHEQKKKVIMIAVPSETHRNELFTGIPSWGYDVTFVSDGVQAITMALYLRPDVIILTPGLTKVRETQVANILKSEPLTRDIPLILGVDRRSEDVKRQDDSILVDAVAAVPFHSQAGLRSVLAEIKSKKKAVA